MVSSSGDRRKRFVCGRALALRHMSAIEPPAALEMLLTAGSHGFWIAFMLNRGASCQDANYRYTNLRRRHPGLRTGLACCARTNASGTAPGRIGSLTSIFRVPDVVA